VAIDGPDAAGKTTLAAELAGALAGVRRPIALSVDGFHRPRDVRRRRGELSPDGYYADCFDYPAVLEEVLTPLSAEGDRSYREAVFDYRRDVPLELPRRRAPAGAALLFEGVFLLRPELRDHWDLRVYLHISPAESLRRALVRDADLFGGADATRERYRLRYLPGQELYRRVADPLARADVVVDNEDPAHPRVLTWRG
jgi:uridine kinase